MLRFGPAGAAVALLSAGRGVLRRLPVVPGALETLHVPRRAVAVAVAGGGLRLVASGGGSGPLFPGDCLPAACGSALVAVPVAAVLARLATVLDAALRPGRGTALHTGLAPRLDAGLGAPRWASAGGPGLVTTGGSRGVALPLIRLLYAVLVVALRHFLPPLRFRLRGGALFRFRFRLLRDGLRLHFRTRTPRRLLLDLLLHLLPLLLLGLHIHIHIHVHVHIHYRPISLAIVVTLDMHCLHIRPLLVRFRCSAARRFPTVRTGDRPKQRDAFHRHRVFGWSVARARLGPRVVGLLSLGVGRAMGCGYRIGRGGGGRIGR
mmetsp:Transcript_19265/g.30799  ORF Transcript_19265/g.30799 Transcript_19265/m.30799 type:complete len:320 (+) Transcript_19265:361-1320(+)